MYTLKLVLGTLSNKSNVAALSGTYLSRPDLVTGILQKHLSQSTSSHFASSTSLFLGCGPKRKDRTTAGFAEFSRTNAKRMTPARQTK